MDKLRQYIRQQVKEVMEQDNQRFVPIPYHVQPVLKTIGLYPFDRYVLEVKHVNTVPPSEEITLSNGSKFYIYFGEEKEREREREKFYYEDKRNHYLIRDKINDLLTQDKLSGDGENDMESPEGDSEEPEEEIPDEEPAA